MASSHNEAGAGHPHSLHGPAYGDAVSDGRREQRAAGDPLPSSENEESIVRDPMGYIAELAGYSDSERWWEVLSSNQTTTRTFSLPLSSSIPPSAMSWAGRSPSTTGCGSLYAKTLRKGFGRWLPESRHLRSLACPALHHLPRFKPNDNAC